MAARRGLEWARKKDRAEAGGAFAEALGFWAGPFLPGASEVERLHDFKERLENLYVEVVLGWSEILLAEGDHETASRILSKALVITSYSIHYTKLYDVRSTVRRGAP